MDVIERAGIDNWLRLIALIIEVAAVGSLVLGALAASVLFVRDLQRSKGFETALYRYRVGLARSLLVAVELLVAADLIGTVVVEGDDVQVAAVRIGGAGPATKGSAAAVRAAIEQLEQWFAGERRIFELAMAEPATPRGIELREGLVAVGYGDTLSYGALARKLGSSPRAI
ncbi:MAG: DUF1622 domain-containing protein, partial [Aliihoeflea sp.]